MAGMTENVINRAKFVIPAGARYYTSGPIITVTGGHGSELQPLHPPLWAVEASGPWAMRARVREAIKLDQGRPVPDAGGNGRGDR